MGRSNQREQVHRYPISDDVAPSRAAYLAVAEAKGCDPLELPPLARTIDPDGMDALLDRSSVTEGPTSTFEYAGCSVTVTDEQVRVDVR